MEIVETTISMDIPTLTKESLLRFLAVTERQAYVNVGGWGSGTAILGLFLLNELLSLGSHLVCV